MSGWHLLPTQAHGQSGVIARPRSLQSNALQIYIWYIEAWTHMAAVCRRYFYDELFSHEFHSQSSKMWKYFVKSWWRQSLPSPRLAFRIDFVSDEFRHTDGFFTCTDSNAGSVFKHSIWWQFRLLSEFFLFFFAPTGAKIKLTKQTK